MAEFCEACAAELGHPYGDFRGLTKPSDYEEGKAVVVLCEGCGIIQVDPNGCCISNNCLKAGYHGHGETSIDGPEYEDGPWAEGWEERSKGGDISE